MKKFIAGAGVTAAVSVLALAPAAGASTGPNNTLDGSTCQATPSGSCVAHWTADVNGSYAGATSGSYEVDQVTVVNGVTTLTKVAGGGPGPFAGTPGSLAQGGTYQLTITGQGGGAIGSVTGTGVLP